MNEPSLSEVKMDLPASMYVNYLARRKADHAKLTAAMSSPAQALEDFKVVGHQIKGNAVSFGFDDLVEIGEKMEKINASNIAVDAPALLAEFSSWISATEKRLSTLMPDEVGS